MPARKVAKKTAKKGGTLDADLTSIAVPFGLLLAKQSLEKLSGTKVKAKKGKNVVKNTKAKTAKRMKRVAIGGSNANAANTANVANAANAANTANVPGVNTMAPKTGANVGGKSVKKGRGRPRSRVGGNANAVVNTVNTTNSGNVSGVNTMAHKTGASVGGKAKKSIKSKKGGKTTPKKTRKTQKGGVPTEKECRIVREKVNKCDIHHPKSNVAPVANNAQSQAASNAQFQAARAAQDEKLNPLDGGKSKAKRGRGRPRKN